MARLLSPRRLVPIAVSAVIVALALRFLSSATHGLHVADVLRALHQIPLTAVAIGATLVVVLYTALGTYEAIIARYVGGPVSRRRAAMGGVLAASIGHALGLGTVSGGAIRYRVYSAAGILYALLPAQATLPYSVFIGVYVISILAGLASSVPAGFGVFDVTLIGLLPNVPQAELWAAVIVYRVLLELLPLVCSSLVFAAYEIWWRLPPQRARAAALRAARQAQHHHHQHD